VAVCRRKAVTGQDESSDAVKPAAAKARRGQWTVEQRRRAVADSRVAGASVQEVARRHGVRANLLSTWRRQADTARTKSVKFAAVKVKAAPADGLIEIDLLAGCVRVRGIVDGTMLREVLAAAR
jgi:transposase